MIKVLVNVLWLTIIMLNANGNCIDRLCFRRIIESHQPLPYKSSMLETLLI